MKLLDHAATIEDIAPIFQDVFQNDDLALTPSTSRDDIEAWDSMNHLNLLMALELRYRVKFSLTEIEAIRNAGDILALIQRKTAAA
jgi:acyl carrier protein